MEANKYCPNCNAQVHSHARRCTNCGHSFSATVPRTEVNVPSRWHYAMGAGIAIAGIGTAIIFAVQLFGNLPPDIQIVVPGTHVIQLDESGRYTIFYEYRSVVDGRVFSTGSNLPGMIVSAAPRSGFGGVEVSQPSTNTTYEMGSRAGVSVLQLRVEEPGTYMVTGEYPEGTTGPDVVLAIGKLNLFSSIVKVLGFLFGGIAIGAIIILRALIKRRSGEQRV